MEKSSMTGRNSRQISSHCFVLLIGLFCSGILLAQEQLPPTIPAGQPSGIPKQLSAHHRPHTAIPMGNSMPSDFKNTEENVIKDTTHVLVHFYDKLRRGNEPVRVVHIGDSHIRGHILPLAIRERFEKDFGSMAVYPDTITYFTSGIARETGQPGIVYHMIGINGATCLNFTNAMQMQEIAELNPDLIIMSFGTNESHGRNYNIPAHIKEMDDLIGLLHEYCPQAVFLLTTPPGSYIRYRRRKSINSRTPLVAKTIADYAARNGMASWDMYNIVGGRDRACLNWANGNYMINDRVHYTSVGYTLQGNLLYEALIKAYNDYVAN